MKVKSLGYALIVLLSIISAFSDFLDTKYIVCICTMFILILIIVCYCEYENNREIDYKNWSDLIDRNKDITKGT